VSVGVYLNVTGAGDQVILYQGDSYAARDGNYDRETDLDAALSLTTSVPGNDITFSKGRGLPNNTGTITLTHEAGGERVITVNAQGAVEE